MISKANYLIEHVGARGQAKYLQNPWNLIFWEIKVSCLRMFAKLSYLSCKISKFWKNTLKNKTIEVVPNLHWLSVMVCDLRPNQLIQLGILPVHINLKHCKLRYRFWIQGPQTKLHGLDSLRNPIVLWFQAKLLVSGPRSLDVVLSLWAAPSRKLGLQPWLPHPTHPTHRWVPESNISTYIC